MHLGKTAHHVQAAFGGHFLTALGHEADVLGADIARDVEHLLRDGALQVHARAQLRPQRAHIGVLDVAAIFAQVQGNEIGAGFFGQQRRGDRVRVGGAARVAQRGDVVDIDAQVDDSRRGMKDHSFCKSIRIWRVESGVPCK